MYIRVCIYMAFISRNSYNNLTAFPAKEKRRVDTRHWTPRKVLPPKDLRTIFFKHDFSPF